MTEKILKLCLTNREVEVQKRKMYNIIYALIIFLWSFSKLNQYKRSEYDFLKCLNVKKMYNSFDNLLNVNTLYSTGFNSKW